MALHHLLQRQLRKLGASESEPPSAEAWAEVLDRVSRTYDAADQDRYLIERSLEISSREMADLNAALKAASESEIARERDRLRAVLESLDAGLIVLDATGCVLYLNTRSGSLLDVDVDLAIGQPVARLLQLTVQRPRNLSSSWEALLARVVNGDALRVDEGTLTSRRGASLAVLLAVSPIRGTEGFLGAVVTFEDLSIRRRAEERLLQGQKLEGIGLMAAGVAHEFNNMLTVISSGLGMIREDVPPESDAAELADECSAAAVRGAELVRTLLALGRPTLERRERLAIGTVMDEVLRIVRPLLGSGLEPVVDRPSPLAETIGDSLNLQQVLVNLVLNSRDAMEGGGLLGITAATIEVERGTTLELAPGIYQVLAVFDTGTGIALDQISRIFDPFFTTKPVGKGSGLGLSTVRSIVQVHGGAVTVTSLPGRGTTFRVYLPTAPALEEMGELTAPVGTASR